MSETAIANIGGIASLDLFKVCATLESAHEPDDRKWATDKLAEWGLTQQECIAELHRRGVFK